MYDRYDEYYVLSAMPKVGQKLKFVKRSEWHFFKNVLANERLLERGVEYTLKEYQIGGSTTLVSLEEFEGGDKWFSLFVFEWETPELDLKKLIGMLPHVLVNQLSTRYEVNIMVDGVMKRDEGKSKTLKVKTELRPFGSKNFYAVAEAELETLL